MDVLLDLTNEELDMAKSYAEKHSISLHEAFKSALFEKIEDEYDSVVADEAYQEYVDGGHKSTPIREFWKELDVD